VEVGAALAAYDDAVARILGIPLLAATNASERVVRCLFKPAFHAECWVELIDKANDSQMTIRAASASIWSFVNARSGPSPGDPVTAWVEPAISVEQVQLRVGTRPWREPLDSIDESPTETSWLGLDGMRVDVLFSHEGSGQSFTVWFGAFDGEVASHRLVRSILETAIAGATWDQSRTALSNALSYLLG
jgi:hypothetical protein